MRVHKKSIKTSAKRICSILFLITCLSCTPNKKNNPNIIIILADDMGYGDIQSFNPESDIPTPNLNKLSEEGINVYRCTYTVLYLYTDKIWVVNRKILLADFHEKRRFERL